MDLQPPLLTPLPQGKERALLLRTICFRHPWYIGGRPIFTARAAEKGGIRYDFAYYACSIIAGNVYHDDEGRLEDPETPYFSSSRNPSDRIAIPDDSILRDSQYYFIVPKHRNNLRSEVIDDTHTNSYGNVPYPIVPSFEHWDFPMVMPKPWRQLKFFSEFSKVAFVPPQNTQNDRDDERTNLNQDQRENAVSSSTGWENTQISNDHPSHHQVSLMERVTEFELTDYYDALRDRRLIEIRDEVCRVTSTSWSIDRAHVIPRVSEQWFDKNNMRDYQQILRGDYYEIDEYSNRVHLRKDIHHVVNHNQIIWFPQLAPGSSTTYLCCYCYCGDWQSLDTTLELHELFHGKPCFPFRGVPREFIFARFAWSILNPNHMPIMGQKERKVVFRVIEFIPRVGRRIYKHETTPETYRKEPKTDTDYSVDSDTDMSDFSSVASAYHDRVVDYCTTDEHSSDDSESGDEDAHAEVDEIAPREM